MLKFVFYVPISLLRQGKEATVARPKIPEERKKKGISISLSNEAKSIASASGNISEYIERAIFLQSQMEGRRKEKVKKERISDGK